MSYLADSAERTFVLIDSMISTADGVMSVESDCNSDLIAAEAKGLLGEFLDSLEKFSGYASSLMANGSVIDINSNPNSVVSISFNHQPETFLTVDTSKMLPSISASISDARKFIDATSSAPDLLRSAQIPCRTLLESLRLNTH